MPCVLLPVPSRVEIHLYVLAGCFIQHWPDHSSAKIHGEESRKEKQNDPTSFYCELVNRHRVARGLQCVDTTTQSLGKKQYWASFNRDRAKGPSTDVVALFHIRNLL